MTDPINELIALGKKSAEGEWEARVFAESADGEHRTFKVTPQRGALGSLPEHDAKFIAAAKNALPRIEAMKAVVDAVKVYYAARDAQLYAKGRKEIECTVSAIQGADMDLRTALSSYRGARR